MTRLALFPAIALSALAVSAPAQAQSPLAFAIEHFNQDYDSLSDIRRLPDDTSRVIVSTRGGGALAAAFAHFNQDYDSRDDVRGLSGATIYSNRPANAADIFAAIRAASREDE